MKDESGQTMIEFALICLVMLILSGGLLDVGRGMFNYNSLASAARYGARWGSVEGGQCGPQSSYGKSTDDWCDQLGGTSSAFWSQLGNKPLLTASSTATCPNAYSSSFTGYYTVSDYNSNTSSTIVGEIARHFDSSSSSRSFIWGAVTPGFDLTKLKVCIQLPYNSTTGNWSYESGDPVTVYIYYPFQPVSTLLVNQPFNLVASSTYTIE